MRDLRSEMTGVRALQMISLYRGLFSEKQFHIFFHAANSCNTKIVNQNFGYIWRKEGRKCWSKVNIFYPRESSARRTITAFCSYQAML